MLEIGCATGSLLSVLRAAGHQVQGVDLSSRFVEFARGTHGLDVQLGDVLELDLPVGHFDLVVIGSGPGALQVSSSFRQLGIAHAVISADPAPGGMFRRWPFFQRLLSWTQPYAPAPRGTRAYERYD